MQSDFCPAASAKRGMKEEFLFRKIAESFFIKSRKQIPDLTNFRFYFASFSKF